MKFVVIIFIITLQIISISSFAQEKEKKEVITVTNVEIPVRVFFKGEAVDNMKKGDFTLFINNKTREIAGFSVKRKRLEEQDIELNEKSPEYAPRYFIMAMNITHFSPEIQKGVNYVINRVLKENDTLLVFINNTSLFFKNLKEKENIKKIVNKYINEESVKAHSKMILYFKEIERASYFTKFKLLIRQGGGTFEKKIYFINDFLKNYLTIWKDYKKRYLHPDINTYYNFSKHLQKIKVEKWVINFFQVEMFPKIVFTGEMSRVIRALVYNWQASADMEEVTFARIISRQLTAIQKEMNVADGFPTEQATKIFTKVGATFHSIFIPSTIGTFDKDMRYKQISSDLENNLRSLTNKTGGELVSSNDLEKAMDKIIKKQDIFYILTYAPVDGEKLESVGIKVKNKKYKLAYDDNIRLEFSTKTEVTSGRVEDSPVEISGLTFKNKKLSFSVSGFVMKKLKSGKSGIINVRIRIKDFSGNSIFDKNKNLTANKEKTNVSLDFKWIKKGEYEIIIDVKDHNTGKTGTDFIKTKVK